MLSKTPVGSLKGYGFILFREKDVVEKAIQAMNGMLIGSNIIKVNYVTSSGPGLSTSQLFINSGQTQTSSSSVISGIDLDRVDDDGGLKINAQNRIMLMQKLASSVNIDLPATQMPTMPVQLPGQRCSKPQIWLHPLCIVQAF